MKKEHGKLQEFYRLNHVLLPLVTNEVQVAKLMTVAGEWQPHRGELVEVCASAVGNCMFGWALESLISEEVSQECRAAVERKIIAGARVTADLVSQIKSDAVQAVELLELTGHPHQRRRWRADQHGAEEQLNP
jgi:hypothetical protein